MDTPTVARAAQLAAQLRGVGINATHDAGQLRGQLPAVLVGPPELAWDVVALPTARWRLLAVASTPDPLTAWEQLDELVHAVGDQLAVETATPTSFALTRDDEPLPAYALTFTH